MSEIVRDEINPMGTSSRTVRVESTYTDSGSIVELYAYFKNTRVRLTSMDNSNKPRSFSITANEMDTLAAQWIKFREDCISAKEAEDKRLADTKAEAFKVAQECPAIKISEEKDDYYDRTYWGVTIEEIGFSHNASNPDNLLATVIEAQNQHIEHLLRLDEVKSIVKAHPEIKVHEAKGASKYWLVSIPSLYWEYSFPIYSSIDLVLKVKEALHYVEAQQQTNVAQSAPDSKEGEPVQQ